MKKNLVLPPEEMWQFVHGILNPMGLEPDKANLDDFEISRLYCELRETDKMFRDLSQIMVFQAQLEKERLETPVINTDSN